MKCRKCNGNMIQSHNDSKCIQCGYQDVKIPEEVLKEVYKSIGDTIVESQPRTPRYYYDLDYRDKLLKSRTMLK